MGWFGHIERIQESRMLKALHSWKPISKRTTGRLKTRRVDGIKKNGS
jgi:hypothetical protein